jgi:phosphatidylinositol alpha-1,6-mannosyltransferase
LFAYDSGVQATKESVTRALVLSPDYPPLEGGIQLVVRRLLEHMVGVEARVVALGVPGDADYDGAQPFRTIRVSRRGARNRAAVTALNARAVAEGLRWRPDVVISGHVVTALATSALRPLLRRPVLQYVHADEFRTRPKVCKLAMRNADAVVAVSEYTVGLAVAAGANPALVHRIHPGVDVSAMGSTTPKATRPTLITVARLSDHYKGHDVVMSALPSVLTRIPNAEWVIVGDGPLRPQLEQQAVDLGVADAVRFAGWVPVEERDRLLDEAHVFAMLSRLPPGDIGGEGFGIVYLEAAARGLPVVAGAVGGALDAVADGETGLLVDPTNPGAVADALVGLLSNPDRAQALGMAGATRARQFTWERHARVVQTVIEELRRRNDSRRG